MPAQLAHDGLGALQLAELVEHEPQPRLHLLVRVQHDPAPRRLDQPRRQRQAQLATRRLLPLALVQAHPDLVQLRLAHDAGQAQKQAVVVGAGVVEALAVADDDAEHRAQLQQLVPVAVVAGQARGVQAQHQAGLAQPDLGDQALEPAALRGGRPRLAEVVVDHRDPLARPAQARGAVHQAILQLRALLVLAHLHGRGLADVDVGELGPVGGAHAIRRPFRRAQHGAPPPISVAAGGPRLGPVAAATGPGASAMALGAVLGAGVEAGSGGDGTASAGSALEAASMLRTRRASGSNVRADTRGTGSSVAHAGRSRSVAARRIRRRRPSGKATAMKRGPRAQRRDRTVRRWPTRGCRGSVTVTAEIRRSAAGAARRVE